MIFLNEGGSAGCSKMDKIWGETLKIWIINIVLIRRAAVWLNSLMFIYRGY